jgi:hypothetical protein
VESWRGTRLSRCEVGGGPGQGGVVWQHDIATGRMHRVRPGYPVLGRVEFVGWAQQLRWAIASMDSGPRASRLGQVAFWAGCRNGQAQENGKKMKEKGKEVGQLEAFGPNKLGSFSIFKNLL